MKLKYIVCLLAGIFHCYLSYCQFSPHFHRRIVSKENGGAFLLGAKKGGVVVDGIEILPDTHSFNTGYFVANISSNDSILWINTLGGEGDIYFAESMPDNGIAFSGRRMFSTPGAGKDFITVLDSNGNIQWQKFTSHYLGTAHLVQTDDSGNVYWFAKVNNGDIIIPDFDTIANPWGVQKAILAKYNSNGDPIWIRTICATRNGAADLSFYAGAIAVDKNQNIYTGISFGDFSTGLGYIPFGGAQFTASNSTHDEIFLLKFDKDGNEINGTRLQSLAGDDYIRDILVDKSGLYLIGRFRGDVQLGSLPQLYVKQSNDMFWIKMDTSYNILWGRHARDTSSANYAYCYKIINKTDSTYFVRGIHNYHVNFGNGIVLNAAPGRSEHFYFEFSQNGNTICAFQADEYENDMCLSGDGKIYTTSYKQALPMDNGPIESGHLFQVKRVGDSCQIEWVKQMKMIHPEITIDIQEDLPSSFSIFPNPGSDKLSIRIPSLTQAQFKLFDLVGKLILQKELQNEETIIDVSQLQRGTYIFRIESEEGIAESGKWIKY